jgi:hypothetical protein
MNEGAIAELVSRGKKDAFFNQNPQRTWFGTNYTRRPATTLDTIIQLPSTPAAFGTRIDIELPRTADIIRSCDIRIQMPTWLPPAVAAYNLEANSNVRIESPPLDIPSVYLKPVAYGWANGFPNFLIQKWQLLADSFIITEGYGNYSSWEPYMTTDSNRAPILNAIAGQSSESDTDIQNRATPPILSFRVPLPGCQHSRDTGLPLCALQSKQKLFLRLWLAPKEKLVESGKLSNIVADIPTYDTCPVPWGGRRIYYNLNTPTEYVTLQESQIGQPTIEAYFKVEYLDAETRTALASIPHSIPYKSQYFDQLVFDKTTWIVGNTVKKILNIRGYFQAMFVQFASSLRIQENKWRDCNPPGGGSWVSWMTLIINAIPRINQWDTQQLQTVAQNIRLPRDIPDNLFLLQFGTEIDHEPAGAFFLTRTHKAELQFQVGDFALNPDVTGEYVTAYLYGQGWDILDIKDGIAVNRFPD